ncbi:hypothetical protein [Roseofilum sp. Belize Diploria]|uniref:hypothetical protein n=1 Tax=Roseofilum sp. Belize Diploria TaxID=2821501 RepID=UPI001B176C8D|nr:hypothetical protein [Roseofilum sp. Belize Diploria]MBP0008078.1 hypothetical protein [Roseofilum sp. Belize Diploria]
MDITKQFIPKTFRQALSGESQFCLGNFTTKMQMGVDENQAKLKMLKKRLKLLKKRKPHREIAKELLQIIDS